MDKILIELYLAREWTQLELSSSEYRSLKPYIKRRIQTNLIGKKVKFYCLNVKGRLVAQYLMRSYDRDVGPKKGIAHEEYQWRAVKGIGIDTSSAIAAFEFIFGSVEVCDDWRSGCLRVAVSDIERKLSRFSSEHKLTLYPENIEGLPTDVQWLWSYLHEQRPFKSPLEEHFVLWDTSQKIERQNS